MKCLLVIDYQEEWRNEKSPYYVGSLKIQIEETKKLIDFCREKNMPIIFTKHIEIDSDFSFKKDSKNSEIISDIEIKDSDTILEKNKISPFFETGLETILKDMKINELIICGILTNLCVRSAVSDGYDRDYNITIIKDCCASKSEEIDNFTFTDLKNTRPEIEIINLNKFMEEYK